MSSGADNRLGVVVLGMGRSGTSAIAGMLVRSGFFAGDESDVLPATQHNARGHFENVGIMEHDEQIVLELGGYWYLPPPVEVQAAARDRLLPGLRRHLDRVDRAAEGRPIAIKDPRIGALLPIWEPVISDHLHPILVVRHPIDVARSLLRRDDTPLPYGLAIWELYMTFLLGQIEGRPITLVNYDRLMQQRSLAADIVASVATRIEQKRRSHVRPADAPAMLDETLRHNRHEAIEIDELLTGRQRRLWGFLDGLPLGEQNILPPHDLSQPTANARGIVEHELYRVRTEHDRTRLRNEASEAKARSADFERQEHQESDARAALQEEIEGQRAALESQRNETQALTTELETVRRRYETVVNSRRWRLTSPSARLGALARRLMVGRRPPA